MTMWYNLPPADYAKGLLFNADRCDEQAQYHAAQGKSWSGHEVERAERNAKRLRAMAMLCEIATVARAGDVDFLNMNSPSQTREDEDAAIAQAEAMRAAQPAA